MPVTSFRVRAIPVGAALQLSRRALALGPDRFTHRNVLELLAEWWRVGPLPFPGGEHPFTFALAILESPYPLPDPPLT